MTPITRTLKGQSYCDQGGKSYLPKGVKVEWLFHLMKREGDKALCVLLAVYSYLYDGEGYYLKVDGECFEDIAATFYGITAGEVSHIVDAAVEIGLFDRSLYDERRILTSASIQKQYLYVKKRAASRTIDSELNLLPSSPETEEDSSEHEAEKASSEPKTEEPTLFSDSEVDNACAETPSAGGIPVEAYQTAAKCPQSKEKHSKAKKSKEKENLLLNPPPCEGEERKAEEDAELSPTPRNALSVGEGPFVQDGARRVRKSRTIDDIRGLEPPSDGVRRNFSGLVESLCRFSIPPDEQYAIIRKSNYGVIGHPVWKGLYTLHHCGGKIRLPGRYLLSL